MTFTECLTYKAPPGFKDELIHGEIRLSPSAKAVSRPPGQRLLCGRFLQWRPRLAQS